MWGGVRTMEGHASSDEVRGEDFLTLIDADFNNT